MLRRRSILLFVALLGTSLLLGMGSAPDRAAKAGGDPVVFRGNIHEFWEYMVTENGNPYYVTCFKAEVETSSGDTFELIYSDREPPATPASGWRQFLAEVPISWWDFGDASHRFEATGRINGTQWFVFPPGLDDGTPTRGRLVGVFDITEGTWEGQDVVGGRASFNFSMEKSEFFQYRCDPEHPCKETVSGKIRGTINVER